MDEVHRTIAQILDGFCENHTDLFPAIDLLKACYEQLPADSETDFFKMLAGRLQSEPIRFPSSANVNRSSHALIIRAWAAFGPADALPKLLFSLLSLETREAMESWAFMIGQELLISLSSYSNRFSEEAVATIKGHCALVTYDQSTELAASRFPSALVEISQRLENLVKKIEFDRNVVQRLRPGLNSTMPPTPGRHATSEVAMVKANQEFDRHLFSLKLSEFSHQMQIKSMASDQEAGAGTRKTGGSHLIKIVDGQLALVREWLEGVDRICRKVWRIQGNAVTPEFVRDVLLPEAFTLIEVRKGAILENVSRGAARTGAGAADLQVAQRRLTKEIKHFESVTANRYESEALELEYKNAPPTLSPAETKGNGHGPIATSSEWRDFHDRFMQLAREEQGRRGVITAGKVLQRMDQLLRVSCCYKEHPEGWERGKPEQGMICLLDTPPHGVWNYCNDGISDYFRERVRLCVAEAGHALPDYQKGTDPEDFWLHTVYLDLLKNNSDSLFCASKEGGMILSVCVASATFCARLERTVVTGEAHLRASGNQAEPPRPQNNEKTAQGAKGESRDTAVISERKSFVLPILERKGWSTHRFAVEAEVDFHTANDYLEGRTRPNRSTRKQLADALGIAVDHLPK